MRKLFIQTLFIMLCCMGTLPVAAQSMSDTQVLEYVKKEKISGYWQQNWREKE